MKHAVKAIRVKCFVEEKDGDETRRALSKNAGYGQEVYYHVQLLIDNSIK